MTRKADVVVIGGGVIGLCTAYHLATKGFRVVVVEKEKGLGLGSSYGNAGLVAPSHCVPLAAPGMVRKGLRWMFDRDSPFYIKPRLSAELVSWLWRFHRSCRNKCMVRSLQVIRDLSFASVKLYEEMAAVDGLEFGFERRGLIVMACSEKGMNEVVLEANLVRGVGVEAQRLTPTEIQQHVGRIPICAAGGVYYPQDRHLVPDRFVRVLANRLEQQMGVEIATGEEVFRFSTSNGRISTVHTTRGDLVADEVVLASGSWSNNLAKELGLRLLIQPAKGYSVTLEWPDPSPQVPCLFTEAKVAMTPMGNHLRFAGTLELAGMDLSISQRRVRAILRAVPRYIPEFDPEKLRLIEIWRGLRPCTPDGLPFLGRSSRYENLTVATGHAMIGISLAPITGHLVSQVLSGEQPEVDLSALALDRF